MNKVLYYNQLFAVYKKLLTDKECEIFAYYYEENLSMGEIALLKNISRSAVGSQIKKVETKLRDYEMKLQIVKKNEKLRKLKEWQKDEKIIKELDEIIEL